MIADTDDPRSPGDRSTVALILLLLTIFGAVLRLRGIGSESLWIDETATWQQVRGDVLSTIIETGKDTYPPLYNLFVLLSVKLFGDAEWALRLPAAIFGTLSIPAVYWLARQVSGRSPGLIAATIHSLSAFAIYYSQEARMYSLLMLAAALFAGATIAWIRTPSWPRALALIGTGFMLLYSHPWGAFSWVAIGGTGGLMLLIGRAGVKRVVQFIGAQFVIFLLFAPWLLVMIRVTSTLVRDGFWIDRPSLWSAFDSVKEAVGGPFALALFTAGWLLALPVFRRLGASEDDSADHRQIGIGVPILIAAAVLPVIAGYLISQITTPIFVARYLAGCLPAATVLAAMGVARFARNWRRLAITLGIAAVAMVPATAMAPASRHSEEWRAVATYLKAEMTPDDCLIMAKDFTYSAMSYYRREPTECLYTDLDKVTGPLPAKARIFVVLSHTDMRFAQLKRQLPGGTWQPALLSFGAIRLAIREPKR